MEQSMIRKKICDLKFRFLSSYSLNFNPFSISVYWWRYRNVMNFGDELNKYLIEKLTKRKVFHVSIIPRKYTTKKILIGIGSIINKANDKTIVWGAGIISSKQEIQKSDYRAVRGPRTQKRLKELGIIPPATIGDPSILLPLIYKRNISKRYKIGLLPHFADYHLFKNLTMPKDVILIDITSNIESVIDIVCSCQRIVSSSLHGLIISNVYNIEAAWVEVSDNLGKDNVKFYDYFESLKMYEITKHRISANEVLNEINAYGLTYFIPDPDILRYRQINLLKTFPYKINIKV